MPLLSHPFRFRSFLARRDRSWGWPSYLALNRQPLAKGLEPRKRPGIRFIAYDGEPGPRQFAKLGRAVDEAKLRVPIAAEFPLAQAAKAHQRLERWHIPGRIVLRTQRNKA